MHHAQKSQQKRNPSSVAKGALWQACTSQSEQLEEPLMVFDLYLKVPWTKQDILSKSHLVTHFRFPLNQQAVTRKKLVPFEHSAAEKQKGPN